jgi:hypothetical protein
MTLSREGRKAAADALAGMKRPVSVTVFTQPIESNACRETRALAEFLAETSPRVSVEAADFVANGSTVRKYGIERIPAIAVVSREGAVFRFEGVPSGYVFESLLRAIAAASAPPATGPVEWLADDGPELPLTVFASAGSPESPAMIDIASRLSFCYGRVLGRAVCIEDFPHLAVRFGIKDLPSVFCGQAAVSEGPLAESELLDRLKKLAGA